MKESANREHLDHEEQVRSFFSQDNFAVNSVGLEIVEAQPDYAVVQLKVDPKRHMNGFGGVQGGALFTLADSCAAVADWRPGKANVTVDSSIQYLSVCRGGTLTATASLERHGSHLGVYHVHIVDDSGNKIAVAHFTLFHIS